MHVSCLFKQRVGAPATMDAIGAAAARALLPLPQRDTAMPLLLPDAHVHHLRRLLGWLDCEVGQAPEELVATVRALAPALGTAISDEGRARLVQTHAQASNVPKYVRQALQVLRALLQAQERTEPPAVDRLEPPRLAAPGAEGQPPTLPELPRVLNAAQLAGRWNARADAFNQWSRLGLDEQLAFAQRVALELQAGSLASPTVEQRPPAKKSRRKAAEADAVGECFREGEVWESPRGLLWRVVAMATLPSTGAKRGRRQAELRHGASETESSGRRQVHDFDAVVGWTLYRHADGELAVDRARREQATER